MPASAASANSLFRQLAILRMMRRSRVGLFGGSFNPAHAGHAHVADVAVTALNLSHLFWLITPQNPFKSASCLATPAERVQSATACIAQCKHKHRMRISRIEETMAMHKNMGVHRTADTIRLISRACPGLRLYWVMGADNMEKFHLWHDIHNLTRRVMVVVVNRPGFASQALASPMASRLRRTPARRLQRSHRSPSRHKRHKPYGWCFIQGRLSPHSATRIRQTRSEAA